MLAGVAVEHASAVLCALERCQETLGVAAVRENARLKLDRLGVVFGSEGGAAERRAQDRFNFDEQRRFRRELGGHRRSQRFNGWRAERERGE